MKKGSTLIKLMVFIVIMKILASVAVPKFLNLACANDMDACKENDFERYELICETYQHKDVVAHCKSSGLKTAAPSKQRTAPEPFTQQVPTIIHDTIRVVDSIYFDTSREACVKKCTDNNTSQSVINFCIKEECDKKQGDKI